MTSVETRFHDQVLTAIENSVSARVEMAMKSVKVLSRGSIDGNVLEHHQGIF